jgi:hypothetical protein
MSCTILFERISQPNSLRCARLQLLANRYRRQNASMIVRISKGMFPHDRLSEAEHALAASEAALRNAIERMPGLIHYYVAIDRTAGQLTNTSVWDNLEHASAMSRLAEMLAQRPVLEAAGVTFEPITNHETLWTITS